MTSYLLLHWLNTVLGACSLEGMLAEREAFKICFVCIFVHKSSKTSPQECVLQQHSCLSVHEKLRQKEYGCSGSKLAEKLRKIFIAGKRNHLVLTQSQSCCWQCRAFCLNREQQIPVPTMLHAPFIKMASLPCKKTNGIGGSAVGWEPDGVSSRAPRLGACEGL